MQQRRLYFDYAASTPVDARVLRAMRPYFGAKFGNPGSLHSFGQEAVAAVDRARETIADALGADFREIIFTGSATEANNLILRGAVAVWRAARGTIGAATAPRIPRIVVSAIEHESVLDSARDLARRGEAEVIEIPVDRAGVVDIVKLEAALTPKTAVVSVMYANNEIGTVEPIREITAIVKEFRAANPAQKTSFPIFHTDASQAFQFLQCRASELGADAITISSHKLYGPKGAGALYLSRAATIEPGTTGGGQEFGLRSGTENVPAIVGFAKAVELAEMLREKETPRIHALAARFVRGLMRIAPDVLVSGAPFGRHHIKRLPNIVHVRIPGHDAADLIMGLDLRGVAIASGSACASRAYAPSHVLRALGVPDKEAREGIRISFGRPTSARDVDTLLARLRQSLI